MMNYRIVIIAAGKWIAFLLLLMPASVPAQSYFSGVITDKDNVPVQGVVIQVDSSFAFSISDKDGFFNFPNLTGNKHTITISHISYKPLKTEIESGKKINITLEKRTYLSEEIIITASRANNSSAVTYTNITHDEIEKYNLGKDIPALLHMTPSVVLTSDAGTGIGYSGIRIRGSDATRINVTINGIPVNDPESHQVYWVDLPDFASSVENMQIQRGIGNSTNGAGAFGGSINMLTNLLSVKPYATVASSAGSFNTFKNTIMFGSGIFSKSFAIEGRVSKITSDGYIDRASSNLQSFFLSGGYYGSKNSLRAVVFSGKEKTYQAWYGVPQDSLQTNRKYNPAGEFTDLDGSIKYYSNQTDNYRQDYYQLIYSHVFNQQLTGNLAFHYTRGKGYYEEYKPGASFSSYGLSLLNNADTTTHTADLIRQLWLSNDFYGLTWSGKYATGNVNVIVGGALNRYLGKHFGEVINSGVAMNQSFPFRYYYNDATKTDANIYARGEYSFQKSLNFFVDLQNRFITYSFDGFDDNYLQSLRKEKLNFFNPKAGISILPVDEIVIYLSAGIGHKEPVRDDFVYSKPSNRPDPEMMIDYESGIRYNSGNVSVTYNSYYMDYKSQLILTGKINDVGEYVRESVKNSYRAGAEIEGAYKFSPEFTLRLNFSFSSNKIESYNEFVDDYDGGPQKLNVYNNTDISFSPSIVSGFVAAFVPFKDFICDLSGKYIGKQFLDNTSSELRKLDPYFVNDVHLAYAIHFKNVKEVSLRCSVYNLFDREYISNGYSYSGFINGVRNDYNYYFPQAGIHFLIGLRVGF